MRFSVCPWMPAVLLLAGSHCAPGDEAPAAATAEDSLDANTFVAEEAGGFLPKQDPSPAQRAEVIRQLETTSVWYPISTEPINKENPAGSARTIYARLQEAFPDERDDAAASCAPEKSFPLSKVIDFLTIVYQAHVERQERYPGHQKSFQYNWEHTRLEMATTVDAILADNALIPPKKRYQTLIAAAASDAAKFPTADGNFLYHNYSAVLFFQKVLAQPKLRFRDEFTQAEQHEIINTILAHQVSPPLFMFNQIKNKLAAAAPAGGSSNATEMLKPDGAFAKKILHPLNDSFLETDENGSAFVRFDGSEQVVFNQLGLHTTGAPATEARWYRPPAPSASWYAMARAVIDEDSLANYTTCDGLRKIIELRGPGGLPYFPDATIECSMQSVLGATECAKPGASDPPPPGSYAQVEPLFFTSDVKQLAQLRHARVLWVWKNEIPTQLKRRLGLPGQNDDEQNRQLAAYPFWGKDLDYIKQDDAYQQAVRLRQAVIEILSELARKGAC